MEALIIPRKRNRISDGYAKCDRCKKRIPTGNEFSTIRGWNWCQSCLTEWEDWKAWLVVILAVAVTLLLFIASIAG